MRIGNASGMTDTSSVTMYYAILGLAGSHNGYVVGEGQSNVRDELQDNRVSYFQSDLYNEVRRNVNCDVYSNNKYIFCQGTIFQLYHLVIFRN